MASQLHELDASSEGGHIAKKRKLDNNEETTCVIDESKTMKYKLRLAEPYNIFYSKIPELKETIEASNTITFSDLLCPSLGKLNKSLQINFSVDLQWLFEQYKIHGMENKPLTILYDAWYSQVNQNINQFPSIEYHAVQMKDKYGTHHSKIGLYFYEDNSVRVVVSTANLYYDDWNNYNQSLWISPTCPKLADDLPDDAGCGATDFKTHLLEYLKSYKLPKLLNEWIEIVKRTDFSNIKVFLITSLPGNQNSATSHRERVESLLSKYCKNPENENWKVIAQASSIGSLGSEPNKWWKQCFLKSLMGMERQAAIIYPSINNVANNYFNGNGSKCLAYQKINHDKQLWIKQYLHTWEADKLGRSRVMPHSKSYCQINDNHTLMSYYLLTSANISKAAWGDDRSYVRSYEAGVLFLPKFFDEKYFVISKERSDNSQDKIFPVMYDLPLNRYLETDEPFTKTF